jgi:hypothetical protein
VARITIHSANANFWNDYRALPISIRARADKQFSLLKNNPRHPSPAISKSSAAATGRKSGRCG